jgi:hypothetical protein
MSGNISLTSDITLVGGSGHTCYSISGTTVTVNYEFLFSDGFDYQGLTVQKMDDYLMVRDARGFQDPDYSTGHGDKQVLLSGITFNGIRMGEWGVDTYLPTFDPTLGELEVDSLKTCDTHSGVSSVVLTPNFSFNLSGPDASGCRTVSGFGMDTETLLVTAHDVAGNRSSTSYDLWRENWFQVYGGGILSLGDMQVSYVEDGSYIINDLVSVAGGGAWVMRTYSVPSGKLKASSAWMSNGFTNPSFSTASLNSTVKNNATKSSMDEVLSDPRGVAYIQGSAEISSDINASNALFVYVDGDLIVNPNVKTVGGLYVATGEILFADSDTLTTNEGTLTVNGGVVSLGGGDITIARNLAAGNRENPAVVVNYDPSIMFNDDIKDALWSKVTTIREVLP